MKSLCLALFLLGAAIAGQLKSPEKDVQTTVIPMQEITIGTDQKFIYYFKNPWIYGSNLFLSSGGIEHENVPPRKRRNAAFLDEEEIESISACLPHPRQLKIEEVLHLRIYKKTEISSTFITDTFVLPEKQLAYVVTDTYMLHEVLFTYKDFHLDTARLTSKDSIDLKTILRQHNPNPIKFGTAKFLNVDQYNIPILFTRMGIILLEPGIGSKSAKNQFIATQDRHEVQDVHVVRGQLYVACGHEGIDVYNIDNLKFNYLMNINGTHVSPNTSLNIIDVSSDVYNEYIYALDQNNGLYFFQRNHSKITYLFNIHFPRTVAFNHHANTFLIIAETVNGIEYIAELFVNVTSKEYYFNRVYIEDTAFNHIIMDSQFAYLISEDDHLIIEHSIFNGFVPKVDELVTTFEEEDLIAFQFMHPKLTLVPRKGSQTAYYLGVAKGELKVFEVTEENPGVFCRFRKRGRNVYRLSMNSTKCNSDDEASGNPYHQCQIEQVLRVNVEDTIIESDQTVQVLVIVLIVLLALLVCGCSALLCHRRWRDSLVGLKKSLTEAKTYSQFHEVEGASIVVGNQNETKQDL